MAALWLYEEQLGVRGPVLGEGAVLAAILEPVLLVVHLVGVLEFLV